MPEDRAAYALYVSPTADRQISKLSQEIQDRLDPAIDALADDPTPKGSIKLQGS